MGLADLFKRGLEKTRSFFAGSFTKLAASSGHFDEDMLDDLEELLIRADCGVQASVDIMDRVKENIKKTGDDSQEAVLASVKERMLEILGEPQTVEIVPGKLNIILMIGVNGTGKTTTSGKLAARYKKEGKRVLMAACDTFRAAAVGQLKTWGERTGTAVIAQEQEGADPASVVFDAIHAAQARNTDVLLVDTAGRLHNKKNLMEELAKIRRVIEREAPDAAIKSLLIIDATTGQNAVIQAEGFGEVTGLDYVGITKLDGSAKGGVAIAVAYQSKKPIVLAGLGESVEDLADFDPELFVNSLVNE
ncbi:MAG: signal recognition particle-docking protein FtsY [Clostridiales bacterium]|jgi:fused signal recognition particle receptor|nr:signal recognition particle-docking protein FtsY [Clostridiales bacterium]MBR4430376.1 signal recognition particle-docking protein FtsY [Clostridiales bacterium]